MIINVIINVIINIMTLIFHFHFMAFISHKRVAMTMECKADYRKLFQTPSSIRTMHGNEITDTLEIKKKSQNSLN